MPGRSQQQLQTLWSCLVSNDTAGTWSYITPTLSIVSGKFCVTLYSHPNVIWAIKKLINWWVKTRSESLGPLDCRFTDGWNDSYPAVVFNMLQHTSPRRGSKYFTGTGLRTTQGSVTDSIHVANLALSLSLSRYISAMVHENIYHCLFLLPNHPWKPLAEDQWELKASH